ncbi:hypothetical protein [Streptomyces sp. NPDC046887]|uniref:hypothetical protein n=1 Tax=Streptomyces sp. NPDC046887 TaxID=3155472 RepID=UPI0033F251D4
MPSIRVGNDTDRMLTVRVEPLGEDFWLKPGERLTLVARAPEGPDSGEPPFEVTQHDSGVNVWSHLDVEPVAYDGSGTEVHCGHQRPAEPPPPGDETEYLLSSPANARRLAESIEELEGGGRTPAPT